MSRDNLLAHTISRRNFLKFTGLGCLVTQASLLSGCTHKKFYNPDQDIILGGGEFRKNDELHQVLAIVNLHQRDHRLIEPGFLPHGIIIDPKNKKRVITFEKDGISAAAIDLDDDAAAVMIHSDSARIFNGHGAFDSSGDRLFCVETDKASGVGYITIRDSHSFDIVSELSSYGQNPHHCQLIDDGRVLAVSNRGGTGSYQPEPSIAYIDLQENTLLERVTLRVDTVNTGHLAITDDNSLVVSSAAVTPGQAGAVSIRNPLGEMLTIKKPEAITSRLKGEALSISIDEKHNIAAITHPDVSLVTFWSVDKKELIKAISIPGARGICLSLDKKHFIVSYAVNTSAIRIDTGTLTADKESIMQPVYASGDHIINWSGTLHDIMPTKIYS